MKCCYKCGRIRCETCNGTGCVLNVLSTMGHDVWGDCLRCEDGWREAERGGDAVRKPIAGEFRICADMIIRGTDPAVLCPTCEKEGQINNNEGAWQW